MSRWAAWIRSAVEPVEGEVERVRRGLPRSLAEEIVEVTSPTDAEVSALLAGRAAWQDRRDRRRRRTWGVGLGLGAAAAAAMAAVTLVVLQPAYGDPDVEVGQLYAMAPEQVVHLGPSIEMVSDASLVVDRAGGEGTVVRLIEGRSAFEVDPDGAFRSLVVVVGDVEVEVVGTRFLVENRRDNARVDVVRGVIEVRYDGRTELVRAGQTWLEVEPVAVDAGADAPDESVGLAVLAAGLDEALATSDGGSPDLAPATPPARQRVPEVTAEGGGVEATPEDTAEGGGVEATPEGTAEGGGVEATPDAGARPSTVVIREEEFGEGVGDGEDTIISAAALADFAALEERIASGEPPAESLKVLRDFLRDHPGTPLRSDAIRLRLEVMARHDPAKAVEEIDVWLLMYPEDRDRIEVIELRAATVRAGLGDCGRALADYRTVAAQAIGARGASASAWLGLCAAEVGEAAEAERALRDALERGVDEPLRTRVEQALLEL